MSKIEVRKNGRRSAIERKVAGINGNANSMGGIV